MTSGTSCNYFLLSPTANAEPYFIYIKDVFRMYVMFLTNFRKLLKPERSDFWLMSLMPEYVERLLHFYLVNE
jgi:hypothetical protein